MMLQFLHPLTHKIGSALVKKYALHGYEQSCIERLLLFLWLSDFDGTTPQTAH